MQHDAGAMRTSETGATRDIDHTKFDYEGFLSPYAIEAFGAYMNFNRVTPAGLRDSDNWQKGMPKSWLVKSAWRHFFDWWREHRGIRTHEGILWALLGLMFNVQGYIHELLKANPEMLAAALKAAEERRHEAQRLKPSQFVERLPGIWQPMGVVQFNDAHIPVAHTYRGE